MPTIKVGSRQSQLAITQTQLVIEQLKSHYPDVDFKLVPYKTKGDRLVHRSLQDIGGKGVFVKDIEQALLDKEVDIAVHSLKDVPALLTPGCLLGAITAREDVRDCLIFRNPHMTLDQLSKGAVIGTSSLRRQVQLQSYRQDLIFKPLRGNIDTRLQKLRQEEYDAIVLAVAGLNRMGWTHTLDLTIEPLPVTTCLPAISQGALGIECLETNTLARDLLKIIHNETTASCVTIERQVLALMNADCTFPIGAYAQKSDQGYRLDVMLATKENHCLYTTVEGTDGCQLAKEAVAYLKEKGALEMP